MVKLSSIFFVAVVVSNAAPSLAHVQESHKSLELKEYHRGLEPSEEVHPYARDILEAVYGRELTDVELEERAPFLGLILAAARIGIQVGARVGARVANKVKSIKRKHFTKKKGSFRRKAARHGLKHHQDIAEHVKDQIHHRRSLDSRDYLGDLLEERDIFYEDEVEGRDYLDDLLEERDIIYDIVEGRDYVGGLLEERDILFDDVVEGRGLDELD